VRVALRGNRRTPLLPAPRGAWWRSAAHRDAAV